MPALKDRHRDDPTDDETNLREHKADIRDGAISTVHVWKIFQTSLGKAKNADHAHEFYFCWLALNER